MKQRIWVAAVDHRHGTDLYAAQTEDGLYAQLAAYCTRDWRDAFPDEDIPPHDLDDQGIVAAYFEAMGNGGDEWLVCQDVEIEISEPVPA